MKKIFGVFTLVICLIFLSSCSLFKNDLEKLFSNLDKKDASYEMKCEYDIPFSGLFEVTFLVEGNKMKQESLLLGDAYYEFSDDIVYEYKKNILGKWNKKEYEDGDDLFNATEYDSKDFELIDGKYVLKEDACEKYDVLSLKITVNEDHESGTFEMNVRQDGINMLITITISNYGKIKVNLPEVE